MSGGLGLSLRVLRAEGWRAVRDRIADRRRDARRRAAFRPASAEEWRRLPPPPVLNLLAMPAQRRLGGLPQQLLARLEEESRQRTVALLAPDGEGWRLEVWRGEERWARAFPNGAALSPVAIESAPFESLVREACAAVGAAALHVEGASGLPLGSLRSLATERPLVLSLHDFGLFCPRPNLLEEPAQMFCAYCTDDRRCAACLNVTWSVGATWQRERRTVAAELLGGTAVAVFASEFLRREHARLFAPTDPGGWRVLAPALPLATNLPARPPATTRRHVALVGAVRPDKGARLFLEVLALARRHPELRDTVRWSAYGGGDAALLRELRAAGVRVRGYYAAGSLPRLLREDGVDLALLLSIVPESHGLTLDECVAAGVPVVALAHGALEERIPRSRNGTLVPPAGGAPAVIAAISAALARPPADAGQPLAAQRQPGDAAADFLALYSELRLATD